MTLNTSVTTRVTSTLYGTTGLSTPQSALDLSTVIALANGTGAGQADRIFSSAARPLAASSSEDLDLAGVLSDPLGATLTFARIKLLLIRAASTNANNVIIGGAGSNGWTTWVGGATHTVTVRPGGLLLLSAPDATAYAVTAATGDLLHVANSGAGTAIAYDVVIIGASA